MVRLAVIDLLAIFDDSIKVLSIFDKLTEVVLATIGNYTEFLAIFGNSTSVLAIFDDVSEAFSYI